MNEDVAALPFQWRLLFIGLWTQADRAGRLEDRPLRLKASLFPYDSLDLDEGLAALAHIGLIVRYEREEMRLISIPTWEKHQQPHVKEPQSELLPPVSDKSGSSTVLAPVQPVGREGKGREQEGNGEGSAEASSAPSTAFLVFPVIGAGSRTWPLSEALIANWAELFPGLDVRGESRKALAWVQANVGNRKTSRGMERFLVRWLTRAVDNGKGSRVTTTPARSVSYLEFVCPHEPKCAGQWKCRQRTQLETARQQALR